MNLLRLLVVICAMMSFSWQSVFAQSNDALVKEITAAPAVPLDAPSALSVASNDMLVGQNLVVQKNFSGGELLQDGNGLQTNTSASSERVTEQNLNINQEAPLNTLNPLPIISEAALEADNQPQQNPLPASVPVETGTRYPIILIHGFLGSKHILFTDYFFGISKELAKHNVVSYTVTLPAVNAVGVRSEELHKQLLALQQEHGYTKFNLVGHSQGGISARQIGGDFPDLVASITTIGSPNNGAFVSDYVLSHPFWRWSYPIEAFGWLGNRLDGKHYPQNYKAYLADTSTLGMAKFNALYPAGVVSSACGEGKSFENGMYHFSFGGVKKMTRWYDPMDWLLLLQGKLSKEPNDGWITSCSTRYGKVIDAALPMNHMDLVNQLFGVKLSDAKPLELYVKHAERLRLLGL